MTHRSAATLVLVALLLPAAASAAGPPSGWPDVPPDLLAETAATVDPGAGVEIVSFDEWLTIDVHKSETTVRRDRRVRLKVFTPDGAQKASLLGFTSPATGARLDAFEVRATAADGTVSAVDRSDAVKQTLVRLRGRRLPRWSLAVPRVAPGSVVDYRVHVTIRDAGRYNVCPFAFDWPARRVSYDLKGPALIGLEIKQRLHRVEPEITDLGPKEFRDLTVTNLPAWSEETWSPSDEDAAPMMLVYEGGADSGPSDDYWRNLGRQLGAWFGGLTAPGPQAKQRCSSLVAGVPSPTARLERIVRWVREDFVVFDDDARDLPRGLKPVSSVEAAIRQGGGSVVQAIAAVGALALGVGGRTRYPASSYPALRGVFEEIAKRDRATVTLVREE